MYETHFSMTYDPDMNLFGNLCEHSNHPDFGLSLAQALHAFFSLHNSGDSLTCQSAYGLLHYLGKFYITDSHSCDMRGMPTPQDGRACMIECDSVAGIIEVCITKLGTENAEFNTHHVDIDFQNVSAHDGQHPSSQITDDQTALGQALCCNTSVSTSCFVTRDVPVHVRLTRHDHALQQNRDPHTRDPAQALT
ncbi:hypothetical protein QAD02_013452 [Eretmocerus hayati]|uniref:Uncharacterized protein n=1 Tax=Eretmocerus hayati TaxID=131215 RepID=A0ACC2P262_9HYME|nr:hypothetical protein QAD02_013452 [Eretmocerus hayati]